MELMQKAFIWFSSKPESQKFHAWSKPHPRLTRIQNEIERLNPTTITMSFVDDVMKKYNKKN